MLDASSGSWTTVQYTGAPKPLSAYELSTLGWCSCMRRFTPVGSTRSKSVSRFVQRKVLTPNDLTDLNALAERLLDFQYYWETTARLFQSKFTRQHLAQILDKLAIPR